MMRYGTALHQNKTHRKPREKKARVCSFRLIIAYEPDGLIHRNVLLLLLGLFKGLRTLQFDVPAQSYDKRDSPAAPIRNGTYLPQS